MNLTGTAIEIGVMAGIYSESFLQTWKGNLLVSIDPWIHQDGYEDIANRSNEDFEKIMDRALHRLKPFKERSEVIRDFSQNASNWFLEESLDMVYLDARHDYDSVFADIEAWLPKIKTGGILAGHDYVEDGVRKQGVFGVKSAVSDTIGLDNISVTQKDTWPSWLHLKK